MIFFCITHSKSTCLTAALILLTSPQAGFADEVSIKENNQTNNGTISKLAAIRDRAANLTENALDMLGVRYKRGGNTPENGLDCSGFVRLVFKNSGVSELPRTSKEISKVGENIEQSELKPGDLVFYNTLRRGFSHVGIYLGDNKFIHSPSAGGQVRIDSMDVKYWKNDLTVRGELMLAPTIKAKRKIGTNSACRLRQAESYII